MSFGSFPSAVMSANERGFDFGAIFQNEITYDKGPDTGAILVLKDSGIKSVKDLVGKKLAASARSSQATVAVDEVLRQHGIDPEASALPRSRLSQPLRHAEDAARSTLWRPPSRSPRRSSNPASPT